MNATPQSTRTADRAARKAANRARYQRYYARRKAAAATSRAPKVARPLNPVGKRIPLAALRSAWGVGTGMTVWDHRQALKAARSAQS